MKAVVQRVTHGSVSVYGKVIASIGRGYVILLGVQAGDDRAKAEALAKKIANLRIFNDKNKKMNLSILDVNGEAIVVSQFTLLADTRKGNRPSFINAAPPDIASPLVDYFIELLRNYGVNTQSGKFGAVMQVEIHNDGPVTILLDA
ncbi:MAG: D-tyrosyl-tRNA(Tyr) deacylase [Pelolinea sp.]|nr:D-tyrosyl-tRNA(Tyr) deacylase [Pelolinea sp.]